MCSTRIIRVGLEKEPIIGEVYGAASEWLILEYNSLDGSP